MSIFPFELIVVPKHSKFSTCSMIFASHSIFIILCTYPFGYVNYFTFIYMPLYLHVLAYSMNVFLQAAKSVEVTRGKTWAVRRMLKCFPAKSLKLIPHQIGSMGTGVIMQIDDSVRQRFREFWLYGVSQHPQPPRNEPHLSALLFLPPFPMLDEHTLHYAHLQSNRETTVWACTFSLCMSPTLEYWYVTTVLPAFARNVFHGGCSGVVCFTTVFNISGH